MDGRDCRSRQAEFRLMEAQSRASAAGSSSSSTDDRVSATFATDLGSGAREAVGGGRRDSGACRSASRPTALQPKKRLTRSRTTSEACWISSAIGPSTRHTSMAGSCGCPSTGRPGLLLEGYDRHRRKLPWRPLPGERANPYSVWLSEIMLQQTGVKTVVPYFKKFLVRWPDVDALGRASLDDVLRMWAGLGYYSRARNLHACAVAVLRDHRGVFPDTEEGLRSLPGIGRYTAAAIAAIAFGRRIMPVDGNIERVVSRLFAVENPLPQAKALIQQLAMTLLADISAGDEESRACDEESRAGDSAQALMDLGASI